MEKREILLTIGMIVKNEEKFLKKTLNSLRPLMEAVPSELVIVDTGSDDATVEIAGQYTENLFHFRWNGDFSAARNKTLEHAKGRWYFYIDADEPLDPDCSSLIDFLKQDDGRYNTATVIVRNYADLRHTDYSDYGMALRLHRMRPGIRFTGKIHEGIPLLAPVKSLPLVLHHDGYTNDMIRKKQLRNRPTLLEEYKNAPEDPRVLRHLSDAYSIAIPEEREERKQILLKLLAALEKQPLQELGCFAYMELAKIELMAGNFSEMENWITAYFQSGWRVEGGFTEMEMHMLLAFCLLSKKNLQQAAVEFDRYFGMYGRHQQGMLEGTDQFFCSFDSVSPKKYLQSLYRAAYAHAELHQYAQAKKLLRKADVLRDRDHPEEFAVQATGVHYARTSGDYAYLTGRYQSLLKDPDEAQATRFLELVEQGFSDSEEKSRELAAFAAQHADKTPYGVLSRLRLLLQAAQEREEKEPAFTKEEAQEARKLIQELLEDQAPRKNRVFADMLLAVFYGGLGLDCLWDALPDAALDGFLTALASRRPELGELLDRYLPEQQLGRDAALREQYWRSRMLLCSLISQKPLPSARLHRRLEQYVEETSCYCRGLYSEQALRPENRGMLPPDYRFALELETAFGLRARRDTAQYLKELRKLIKEYPERKELLRALVEQTQQELDQDQDQEQDEEFRKLADSVKAQFYRFLEGGQEAESRQILAAYRQVNGSDPEITWMAKKLEAKFGA